MRLFISLLLAGHLSLASASTPTNVVLPPMRFATTLKHETLIDEIKAYPAFANIDNKNLGAPILLRVTHTWRATAGGDAAGVASGLLAGSSLGILPVVTNRDMVITYEILVHGTQIAAFEFVENFTSTVSIYSEQARTGALSESEKAWLADTLRQFDAQVQHHEGVRELLGEYQYYFGS